MENLKELLIEELKDPHSAEKQIVKAGPRIARGAESEEPKSAITDHLEATKGQVTRLEEQFSHLEMKPRAKHCKGMEGLLQEGAECLEGEDKGSLRDLQLIGAAQRVEYYEVAAYGTARAMAQALGIAEAVELFSKRATTRGRSSVLSVEARRPRPPVALFNKRATTRGRGSVFSVEARRPRPPVALFNETLQEEEVTPPSRGRAPVKKRR